MPEFIKTQQLQELPKPDFLLVTTEDGEQFLVTNVKKTREWIRIYHPDWNIKLMPLHTGPQGVHIIKARMTLCDLSHNRKNKWGQNLADAFVLVAEEATCPTCIGRNKVLDQPSRVTAVLRPWDWSNVPEAYRPGGDKYYGGRI